jgi:hypothetical protein
MARGWRFALTAVSVLGLAGLARAGDEDLKKEVEATRRKVEDLQRRLQALGGKGAPPPACAP